MVLFLFFPRFKGYAVRPVIIKEYLYTFCQRHKMLGIDDGKVYVFVIHIACLSTLREIFSVCLQVNVK